MKNNEVALLLSNIADLLDIKGDNFFKIRAYRIASQIISDLPEDIKIVVQEKRLEKIDGIGPAISEKITEYINNGKLLYFENLKKEIPLNLLEFLDISGLGPKKVSTLFHKLNIVKIDELKKACKQGKLRNLDGFGELTEHNILRGIALKEKTQGRILLHYATEIGEKLISYLKESKFVENIDVAGSLRRKKETIGDIDILISTQHPKQVMDWAVKYPDIDRIIANGMTKTSILLSNNIQVDIRAVEEKSYGSALQYFTGSKEHNVSMRSLALKKGFKLNEYGLFQKKNEIYITGSNEKEIYRKLNLSFIPPELRENRGEINESINDKLPILIESGDIKGDLHVHSTYSDGHDTIQTMVKTAEKLGYEYIGIADHSQSLHVANGLNYERILQKSEEIKKLNKTYDISIFLGTECDILPNGNLDYDEDTLELFDYIGIGIHTKFKMSEKEATERIVQGMSASNVMFLAHPTCRLFGYRNPIPINMETLFEIAIETKTALEINSSPDRLDLSDIHVQRGKNVGVKFIIGTDAHHVNQLKNIKYGISTARRGWLEKSNVLNTLSNEEIKSLFKN